MTELLEHAVKTMMSLPSDMQDELALMILQLTGVDQPVVDLTPAEEAAVLRSREAAARGDFATEADRLAIWAKHGL